MLPLVALLILAAGPTAASGRSEDPAGETIAEITVHGNVLTPDMEVIRLSGLHVGDPAPQTVIDDVEARLTATKRFEHLEVRKRYASLSDPSQILIVIIVDEGPVSVERTGDPNQPVRVRRGGHTNVLWLPILEGEDGYGLSYGVRATIRDRLGHESRLSFPATWGGDRRAAAEFERAFDRGPFTRVEAGGAVSERTHPFFDADVDRQMVWGRAERRLSSPVTIGITATEQHVSLLGAGDRITSIGGDAVYDSRLDPFLARNAVYARAAWQHMAFDASGTSANVSQAELRGYLGTPGQSVLVLRALWNGSDSPLPGSEKALFGGLANVRGFRAGTAVDDKIVASSVELRLPIGSPLRFGKIGISVFADTGTAYDAGERIGDQTLKRGYGGGLWFTLAFMRAYVAVAHGRGAATQVHFSGTVGL